MYKLNKQYKFELPNRIFYTATVLEEDSINVRILTRMNENIVLSKNSIIQSKEIENSIGEKDVKG